MLTEIKQWLDNPARNYATGLSILVRIGEDKSAIDLCSKYQNSFTEDKLYTALKQAFSMHLERQPVKEQVKQAVESSEDIKDTVIRLMEERRKRFRETLDLRRELKKTHPLLYRGQIDLASALNLMDSRDRKGRAIPFSIVAISFNDSLSTGGEVIYFPKAQLAVMDKSNRIAEGKRAEQISNRNPNHWVNGTRNIRPYDSKEIRKISIWLILQFNEMEVNLGHIG